MAAAREPSVPSSMSPVVCSLLAWEEDDSFALPLLPMLGSVEDLSSLY
jgi:hypothetical protein